MVQDRAVHVWEVSLLSGVVLGVALLALLACVFLATRPLIGALLPERSRRWAWLPIAAILTALLFADEGYNEYRTRLACSKEGGMVFGKLISAPSTEEGLGLIDTTRLDTEEAHFWKHELLFVYRPTGEELARLRWFDRKHGWVQGNEPGTRHAGFTTASPCPDPQPYLVSGAARSSLVRRRWP